jgi:hypothetical protein
MTKGKPNARSQGYKAIRKLQDKLASPKIFGNDDIPSPIYPTITPDDGAQRLIDTINVLLQSLDLVVSPNPHGHALVKLVGRNISDFVQMYQNAEKSTIVLQQQLDDANAKLLAQFEVQNAEILKLEDQLKKSQAVSDFYREQAVKAGVVPSLRRSHSISSDNDHLTKEQLLLQLSLASTDLQVRDFALEQLQLQNTAVKSSLDQVLTSSSELLTLHVTLLEQHLQLQARLKVSTSAVTHYRNQFLEYSNKLDAQLLLSQQTSFQLQETGTKYDKLLAQVTKEDPILRSIVAHGFRAQNYHQLGYSHYGPEYIDKHLHTLSGQLLVFRPDLRPQPSMPH